MAWLSGNKIAWKYTDGDGTEHKARATKAITDQVDGSSNPLVGGTATGALTLPVVSKSIRVTRAVKCSCSGYPDKWVTCYSASAPLMTPGTSINLNSGVDSHAYSSAPERRDERKRKHPGISETT